MSVIKHFRYWLIFAVMIMLGGTVLAQEKPQRYQTTKIIEYLPGEWEIRGVYDGKKDITADNDSIAIQHIEFTRDGKYIVKQDTQKIDSGAYRLNENHNILYLESAADRDNPSEWNINFKDGTMILSGRKASAAKTYRYVYARIGVN